MWVKCHEQRQKSRVNNLAVLGKTLVGHIDNRERKFFKLQGCTDAKLKQ